MPEVAHSRRGFRGAPTSPTEGTPVKLRSSGLLAVTLASGLLLSACGDDTAGTEPAAGETTPAAGETTPAAEGGAVSGTFTGDGSSTVFPIMEAVAEEFTAANADANLEVGVSGTGGGFERFCAGETDFSNASRPIKEEEEQACADGGVEFTEFLIASDGISIVSNNNTPIECLTTEQLQMVFRDGGPASYADIDPALPAQDIELFIPGTDSGTYDFFFEEVLEEEGTFKAGSTQSEDDNTLVTGIEGTEGGIGFFGFAYYENNADQLNLVQVDDGNGCTEPSEDTIRAGEYTPLSRPLFVYVKNESLDTDLGKAVIEYVLTEGRDLVSEVGYVQRTDEEYQENLDKIPA